MTLFEGSTSRYSQLPHIKPTITPSKRLLPSLRYIAYLFQAFVDPNSGVSQISLAHFVAVQADLTPILYLNRVGFEGTNAPPIVMSWIEETCKNI